MYKLETGFVSCLHKTAIFINSDVLPKYLVEQQRSFRGHWCLNETTRKRTVNETSCFCAINFRPLKIVFNKFETKINRVDKLG